jgi:hypothetical protein
MRPGMTLLWKCAMRSALAVDDVRWSGSAPSAFGLGLGKLLSFAACEMRRQRESWRISDQRRSWLGRSSSRMRCPPRFCPRCSRGNRPVRRAISRTYIESHCTLTLRPIHSPAAHHNKQPQPQHSHPGERRALHTGSSGTAPAAASADGGFSSANIAATHANRG